MNISESKPFLLPIKAKELHLPGSRQYIVRVHAVDGGVQLAQDILNDDGVVLVPVGTFVSKPDLVVIPDMMSGKDD